MTVDPEVWLDALRDRLPSPPGSASAHPPPLSADEREVLLDLARVAAHSSERWTAPLSTFLAGVAYGTSGAEQRTVALRALVADLGTEGE